MKPSIWHPIFITLAWWFQPYVSCCLVCWSNEGVTEAPFWDFRMEKNRWFQLFRALGKEKSYSGGLGVLKTGSCSKPCWNIMSQFLRRFFFPHGVPTLGTSFGRIHIHKFGSKTFSESQFPLLMASHFDWVTLCDFWSVVYFDLAFWHVKKCCPKKKFDKKDPPGIKW